MNVEQYKNRFYNLMESTIGNVKPLITEEINCGKPATFFSTKPNDLSTFLSDIKTCKSANYCPHTPKNPSEKGPNYDLAMSYVNAPSPDKMWGCVKSMIYNYGGPDIIEEEGMEIFNYMIEYYGGTWRIVKNGRKFEVA